MTGDYWHSELHKDKNYHLNKTELVESKDYQLIHIFEYEWLNPIKQDIIKAKIKSLLNIDQNRIFARKCEIKEISAKEKNEFLNQYHIQHLLLKQYSLNSQLSLFYHHL